MTNKVHHFAPYRMRRNTAAYYCGMSISSFNRAVEAEDLPKGRKEVGGIYWLRHELEEAMDEKNKKVKKINFDVRI